ncbi:ORF92 [Ranid herpesvirus 1]|uniref:ORF92 n=1 Tax=Ranid herpesvirus 1 TaxID=85655 RepID=Q14VN8_9VIRU|nr:ORF92 [Ranid herpesvirus 1]ABG25773.1 ORF92 [Ranid herpesvirus 1]
MSASGVLDAAQADLAAAKAEVALLRIKLATCELQLGTMCHGDQSVLHAHLMALEEQNHTLRGEVEQLKAQCDTLARARVGMAQRIEDMRDELVAVNADAAQKRELTCRAVARLFGPTHASPAGSYRRAIINAYVAAQEPRERSAVESVFQVDQTFDDAVLRVLSGFMPYNWLAGVMRESPEGVCGLEYLYFLTVECEAVQALVAFMKEARSMQSGNLKSNVTTLQLALKADCVRAAASLYTTAVDARREEVRSLIADASWQALRNKAPARRGGAPKVF